jgi:hypothetical protein
MHGRDQAISLNQLAMAVAGQLILVRTRPESDPMPFEKAGPFADYGVTIPRRALDLFQPKEPMKLLIKVIHLPMPGASDDSLGKPALVG